MLREKEGHEANALMVTLELGQIDKSSIPALTCFPSAARPQKMITLQDRYPLRVVTPIGRNIVAAVRGSAISVPHVDQM